MPASHHAYTTSRKPFIGTLDHHPSGPESAAKLLQSVKEQEVQFDELARQLEAERQSVAHQIERCHLSGDPSGMSMSRVGVHHESPDNSATYRWSSLADDTDLSFHVSGSQLVDSCLIW